MFSNVKQVIEFFEKRKKLGIQLGLDRIKYLLNALDNPQEKIKAIHVAGTNGKGSSINFISSALIANGYKVGIFMSPSFDGLAGHILCNGQKISMQQFVSLFNEVYPVIKTLDESEIYATEFEIITAMSMLYFSNHVDIALIETGMGGRDDTTNCFQPILSIITNIDHDHTDLLGETIAEIATHKVGIIKRETPVIVGNVSKDALTVITNEVGEKLAPLFLLNKDFTCEILEQTTKGQMFIWKRKDKEIKVCISMLGVHQVINCTLAMMALHVLETNGINLHLSKTIEGISSTTLPGRFEVIPRNRKTIILDSAHNIAGIKSFIETVKENYGDVKRKHLIFAAFRDKDYIKMLNKLTPHFSSITLTTFNHQRAVNAQSLKNMASLTNKKITFRDVPTLINKINQTNGSDERYYFFTGSLHFIAYIRKLL